MIRQEGNKLIIEHGDEKYRIYISDMVGSGAFGKVYKSDKILQNGKIIPCAAKIIQKSLNDDDNKEIDIQREIQVITELYSENVLEVYFAVVIDEQNGIVKIADFGLSKFTEDSNAQINHTVNKCTPIFSSPQVILEQGYSYKADIYSLGVVLYKMIFRQFPVQVKSLYKLHQLFKELQEKSQEINIDFEQKPDLNYEIKDIIRKMMMFKEDDRIKLEDLIPKVDIVIQLLQNSNKNSKNVQVNQQNQFCVTPQGPVEIKPPVKTMNINRFNLQQAYPNRFQNDNKQQNNNYKNNTCNLQQENVQQNNFFNYNQTPTNQVTKKYDFSQQGNQNGFIPNKIQFPQQNQNLRQPADVYQNQLQQNYFSNNNNNYSPNQDFNINRGSQGGVIQAQQNYQQNYFNQINQQESNQKTTNEFYQQQNNNQKTAKNNTYIHNQYMDTGANQQVKANNIYYQQQQPQQQIPHQQLNMQYQSVNPNTNQNNQIPQPLAQNIYVQPNQNNNLGINNLNGDQKQMKNDLPQQLQHPINQHLQNNFLYFQQNGGQPIKQRQFQSFQEFNDLNLLPAQSNNTQQLYNFQKKSINTKKQ
ncbi:hypothetical protein ABPG74_016409 [Tetrahymena malaccensis]